MCDIPDFSDTGAQCQETRSLLADMAKLPSMGTCLFFQFAYVPKK